MNDRDTIRRAHALHDEHGISRLKTESAPYKRSGRLLSNSQPLRPGSASERLDELGDTRVDVKAVLKSRGNGGKRPDTAPAMEKTLPLQAPNRFSERSSAHPHHFRQLRLRRQSVAGGKSSHADQFAELSSNNLVERAAVARNKWGYYHRGTV
jgi:hypothetical protein